MNLIIFTIIISVCDGFRILCLLPYPGKSHHMVFEPLLGELTARGHHLTVVSFFPSKAPQSNRRDVSLVGLAPLNVEVVDLRDFEPSYFDIGGFFRKFAIISNLAKSNLKLCETLINDPIFQEFVEGKGDYDVIILEHFLSDCMLGLVHNYGLPSVGLMSCVMMTWTPSRVGASANPATFPSLMLPITYEMSFLDIIENAFYIYVFNIWFDYAIRIDEQRILESRLGRKLPPLSDVGRNTSVLLVNAHHTWNGVKVMPPSVIEVGGIHLHNKSLQPLSEHLDTWMNEAEHGTVLFSFGSLIRGSSLPPKRLDAILKVFARLKQRVVWKWEDDIMDLPNNVMVVKWLPQYDLLRHRNCVAFITHGGMLSLTEAVAAGVPALVVPVLGDQPGNAAHARKAGFAEVLLLDDIEEDTMYRTLMRVLTPEMRARAKALSQEWWDRPVPPMDAAVYYVERTARYRGLNMSSHARWISGFQLAIFEPLGLVLVLIVGILVVIGVGCWSCKKGNAKLKQS